MPVTFLTASQHMTFVDQTPLHHVQNAYDLLPNQTYDVFVVLENSDPVEALAVQVHVIHSAFGIGVPGGPSYITQPAPVNVPPALDGTPGQATIQFEFTTPPAGHGCLSATILPNGPTIGQNVTIYSVVPGANTTLSFLVFGSSTVAEQMTLQLTETLSNGSLVQPADSWHPLLVAPAGLTASTAPTHAPITLSLGKATVYSIGLQVTVPSTATQQHIFHITGTIQTPNDAGEVDIAVNPTATHTAPPHPYVSGSYHSPDIILIDPLTHLPVPLFNDPSNGDTVLRPNTDYGFQVVVHNDSPTPAVNTTVRFWEVPGGNSTLAIPVDVQTASVPANGQVTVVSAHPYHSAPAGEHRCAAVSIYNSQSTCHADMTVFYDTHGNPHYTAPRPGSTTGDPDCATWRNTDSMSIFIGKPWQFQVGLGAVLTGHALPEIAVQVDVTTQRVPADHARNPLAIQANQTLRELGGHPVVPTYLLTAIRTTLPHIELGTRITGEHLPPASVTPHTEAVAAGTVKPVSAIVKLPTGKPIPITVHGTTPQNATAGDIYLVEVAAHYPSSKISAGETVRFTYALYVKK